MTDPDEVQIQEEINLGFAKLLGRVDLPTETLAMARAVFATGFTAGVQWHHKHLLDLLKDIQP